MLLLVNLLAEHAGAETSRLTNLSARASISGDNDPLIAGFVVAGNSDKPLLVRAIGPTLENFGVSGALADPTLVIFSTAATFASNDDWGAIDQPINPMRTLLNTGATFVARSHATQVNHMTEMMLRAAKHPGFSVVEILSECVELYEGAFDSSVPRKGGKWTLIEEKKNDGTPEDANRHDVTDEVAAFKLSQLAWPGSFGVFYESNARKTKNQLEADLIANAKAKTKNATDLQVLQATFARLR